MDHEATEAFFSRDGRARTKAQIDQREDCFVLKEGLGAAFLVEPASGTLPPWGVATVAVTVFNDTPGRYTDKVDITFTGVRPLWLPRRVIAPRRASAAVPCARPACSKKAPTTQQERLKRFARITAPFTIDSDTWGHRPVAQNVFKRTSYVCTYQVQYSCLFAS